MKLTQHIGYTAPTANPLLFRTYCRMIEDANGKLVRESAQQAIDRAIRGLDEFGLLTEEEVELIRQYFYQNIVFPSGRWFWIGGTDWIKQQKNYIGAYNCASVPVVDWEAFRFNFRALLMGCGVGTVVELDKVAQLPSIKYPISLGKVIELGSNWEEDKNVENSYFYAEQLDPDNLTIDYVVGDSKEGWVSIATDLLEFASTKQISSTFREIDYKSVILNLDLSRVRPKGIPLKGFGGLSNPERLEAGLRTIIKILNGAVGRQLTSLDVIKIGGTHGIVTVAGEIRRSAKIEQGSPEDELFVTSKDNLWIQDEEGNWKIDPERDMLRMANQTLCYHKKPSKETVIAAVRKQYYSGEGVIQYTPEAIARCNVDLLDTVHKKKTFLTLYCSSKDLASGYLQTLAKEKNTEIDEKELIHRISRYSQNPCAF